MNIDTMEIYRSKRELVLPELMGLGWNASSFARFGGPRHDGRNCFEIGYLHSGALEWLTDKGLEEAGPGSIIIDWPGDWQGGESAILHPCERYWVRFNFEPARKLPGLPRSTVRALGEIFNTMSARHFPASPQMRDYFEQLLSQQRKPGLFAQDVSRAAFHQILLLTASDYQRRQQTSLSAAVQQAVDHFDSHMAEPCQIDPIAKELGLSVGYFHKLFLREVGLPPSRYHLQQRIRAAKQQLIIGKTSITELSMALGFSSSQHFATAFKKIVGLSPGAYRRLRDGTGQN